LERLPVSAGSLFSFAGAPTRMIRTSLILTAALALAACGKNGTAEANQAFSDEDFTQSAIVANDVTAIDAATGDAANMAADVPPDAAMDNGAGDEGSTAATPSRSEVRDRRGARDTRGSREEGPATPGDDTPTTATPGNTEN